jgi:hypothetical protein
MKDRAVTTTDMTSYVTVRTTSWSGTRDQLGEASLQQTSQASIHGTFRLFFMVFNSAWTTRI